MDAKMLEKAKPILMSTPMVQAILAGRKTQTRRVIKLPKWVWEDERNPNGFWFQTNFDGGALQPQNLIDYVHINRIDKGDILWVRETILQARTGETYPSGEFVSWWNPSGPFEYIADGAIPHWTDDAQRYWMATRPSIHMPRKAARLFLRVTGVRAERLQNISEADALAEGVSILPSWAECGIYRRGFETLWDSLNAKRDGGIYAWDSNPWVWVYTFERCEKTARW